MDPALAFGIGGIALWLFLFGLVAWHPDHGCDFPHCPHKEKK